MVIAGPLSMRDQLEKSELDDISKLPWIWQTACGPFHQGDSEMFCQECFEDTKSIIAEDDATLKSLIIAGAGLGLMLEKEAVEAQSEGKIIIWPKQKITVDLSFIVQAKRQEDPVIKAMINTLERNWNDKVSI